MVTRMEDKLAVPLLQVQQNICFVKANRQTKMCGIRLIAMLFLRSVVDWRGVQALGLGGSRWAVEKEGRHPVFWVQVRKICV